MEYRVLGALACTHLSSSATQWTLLATQADYSALWYWPNFSPFGGQMFCLSLLQSLPLLHHISAFAPCFLCNSCIWITLIHSSRLIFRPNSYRKPLIPPCPLHDGCLFFSSGPMLSLAHPSLSFILTYGLMVVFSVFVSLDSGPHKEKGQGTWHTVGPQETCWMNKQTISVWWLTPAREFGSCFKDKT